MMLLFTQFSHIIRVRAMLFLAFNVLGGKRTITQKYFEVQMKKCKCTHLLDPMVFKKNLNYYIYTRAAGKICRNAP